MNVQTQPLAGDVAEELNIIPECEGTVLRLQRGLLAAHREKRLRMQTVFTGSLFFSYSGRSKGGTDRVCTRSYAAMAAELGCSKSSVARSMAELKAENYVERVRQSAYKYTGPDSGFDRIELWMLTSEHKLKGGRKVRFTKCQAAVFAYIYSHKDKEGSISLSASVLAYKLGISMRCAGNALKLLQAAGYISRPEEDKGRNRFRLSTWHVDVRLLNRKRRSARKAQKVQEGTRTVIHKTQAQAEAEKRDERAAYDSFTALRRQRAEDVADMNRAKALRDRDFKEADKALTVLNMELGKASLRTIDRLPELLKKQAEYKALRAKALKRLKLTEADIAPRYECRKCRDTGYLDSGGICPDCWAEFKKGRN